MRCVRMMMVVMIALCLATGAALAGEAKQVKLDVSGMMCGSCENKVKTSLQKVEGVKSADVDWNAGTAVVMLNKEVKDEALVKAVKNAGSRFDAKVTDKNKQH